MKFLILTTLFILQACNGFEAPMASPRFQPNPETPTHFEPELPHYRTPAHEDVVPVEPTPVFNEEPVSIEETDNQPIVIEEPISPIVVTPEPVEVEEVIEVTDTPSPTPEPIISVEEQTQEVAPVEEPIENIVAEPVAPVMEPVVEEPISQETIVVEEVVPEVVEENSEEPVQLFPAIPLISSKTIPEGTREIVSMFVFYASLFNKQVKWEKLIIKMEPAPKNFFIGYCSMVNNNQNPQITLNGSFWNQLSFTYQEQLLFHELGHCLLNRAHEGNDFFNPTSIMNKSFFSEATYKNQYDFFIKELFGDENHQEDFSHGTLYPHIH